MKIPRGMTEKDVLTVIDSIVNQIASVFSFGYHDINDMKQQGRLLALEALEKEAFNPEFISASDEGRGCELPKKLYRFMFSHVRHRLSNFKRDNHSRNEPPCLQCPFYDKDRKKSTNQCAAFEDKNECDKWARWYKRNQTKQNLNSPIDINELSVDSVSNAQYSTDLAETMHIKQMRQMIDDELPASLRSDYLRFLSGARLPKVRMEKLNAVLLAIVQKNIEPQACQPSSQPAE